MRYRVSARIAGIVLATVLAATAQPAVARAAYAYDYGINYDVPPWTALCEHHNFTECALIAAGSQAAKGYTTRVDDECRDVWAYNNLGVSGLMNIIGHGAAGWTGVVDQVGGDVYFSALSSSFSVTGLATSPMGVGPPRVIQSTSMVVDQSGSPAKLVVCHWCQSGADPPSGKNMLWALVGYAGVDCAVGFKKPVLICAHERFGGMAAYYDWQYKYWLSLKLGYNADYSRTISSNYILGRYGDTAPEYLGYFGAVWGYGEHNLKGDGNVRL